MYERTNIGLQSSATLKKKITKMNEEDSVDSFEASSNTSEGTQGVGELTHPELETIKSQMGLVKNKQQTQPEKISALLGNLLKEWKLIPENHVIDEKILMGIVDKDNDDEFSYNDFVNNFPKYETDEVNKFVEKS